MNETMDYSKFWFCGFINQPRVLLTGNSLASYTTHQAQSEQSPSFASSRRPYSSHDGRRQWKSGKTKASKGTAIALRVRFTAFYIFWLSFAKQQREVTKFFRGLETANPKAEFSSIFFGIQRSLQILCWGCIRIVDNWRHYSVTGKFTHCAECLLLG